VTSPTIDSPPRDEAVDAHGVPRPHYAALLAALDETNLAALSSSVRRARHPRAGHHDRGEREAVLHIDPVPRIIEADEFAALERGLAQRVRALDFFVADAHGPREAVRAGVIGAGVIDSSRYFERDLLDAPPPVRIGIAGPDLVRGPEGELVVLEDNVRTPTLMGYAASRGKPSAGGWRPPACPRRSTPLPSCATISSGCSQAPRQASTSLSPWCSTTARRARPDGRSSTWPASSGSVPWRSPTSPIEADGLHCATAAGRST
jgi:hypothetical protein